MVQVDIEYQGGLRCKAIHGPSNEILITDAPVDNHGKGAYFSPTAIDADPGAPQNIRARTGSPFTTSRGAPPPESTRTSSAPAGPATATIATSTTRY